MNLKFRVYNKREKIIEYIKDLYWFEQNMVHDFDDPDYIFMASSNCFDRRNTEIYEGDIVLVIKNSFFTTDQNFEVKSIDDKLCLCNKNYTFELNKNTANSCVCIGNIHTDEYLL